MSRQNARMYQSDEDWVSDLADDPDQHDDDYYPSLVDTYNAQMHQGSSREFDDGVVCGFCRPIIEKFVGWRRDHDEEEFVSEHPRFYEEKLESQTKLAQRILSCKICKMVAQALKVDAATRSNEEVWWELGILSSRYTRPMLAVGTTHSADSVSAMFKIRYENRIRGVISVEAGNDRSDHDPQLQSSVVSYDELRLWYALCREHGGSLQDKPLFTDDIPSSTIRLIDVSKKCLVDVATNVPYIALSYVWGRQSNQDDKSMSRNVQQLYKPGGLERHAFVPPTVRDAMEVTKSMGFQYIFVDRFCIVQDSPEDVKTYVDAMHEIYNKASVTIVAAAGDGAHSGLPGTRGTPRKQPRLFSPRLSVAFGSNSEYELVQVEKEEMPPSDLLEKHLTRSFWSSRGWCYQEENLSERRLIFTDRMVFWKCAHVCWLEDSTQDQHELLVISNDEHPFADDPFGRDLNYYLSWHYKTQEVSGERLRPFKWEDDVQLTVCYRSRIREFCARNLSFASDIARAFQGITNAFRMVHDPLPVHHGLLAGTLPVELSWACPGCVDGGLSRPAKHIQHRAATGSNTSSPFPSWSWFAWQNSVTWDMRQFRKEIFLCEMREPMAMITSVYTGDLKNGGLKCIYDEPRPLVFASQQGGGKGWAWVPPSWIVTHPLREAALVFQAQVRRIKFFVPKPDTRTPASGAVATELHDSPFNPADFLCSDDRDRQRIQAGKLRWLQRPTVEDIAGKDLGVLCLTFSKEPLSWTASRGAEIPTIRCVVMMLVSYNMIANAEIARRVGLFRCDDDTYKSTKESFRPETVFLC